MFTLWCCFIHSDCFTQSHPSPQSKSPWLWNDKKNTHHLYPFSFRAAYPEDTIFFTFPSGYTQWSKERDLNVHMFGLLKSTSQISSVTWTSLQSLSSLSSHQSKFQPQREPVFLPRPSSTYLWDKALLHLCCTRVLALSNHLNFPDISNAVLICAFNRDAT